MKLTYVWLVGSRSNEDSGGFRKGEWRYARECLWEPEDCVSSDEHCCHVSFYFFFICVWYHNVCSFYFCHEIWSVYKVNGLSPIYEDCMLEVKGGKHVGLPCVLNLPRLLGHLPRASMLVDCFLWWREMKLVDIIVPCNPNLSFLALHVDCVCGSSLHNNILLFIFWLLA